MTKINQSKNGVRVVVDKSEEGSVVESDCSCFGNPNRVHSREGCPNRLVKYEVAKHDLQFQCDHAVYRDGEDSSICYCTDEKRAELIAKALEAYHLSQQSNMDSAPKDGTDILAFDGTIWRPIHWTGWGGGCWRCSATGHNIVATDFEFWAKMPDPPIESTNHEC